MRKSEKAGYGGMKDCMALGGRYVKCVAEGALGGCLSGSLFHALFTPAFVHATEKHKGRKPGKGSAKAIEPHLHFVVKFRGKAG